MAALAPLIVILGPTASGKTAVGVEVAKKINGEIICADSRTIYKGMDIGTAKPSQEEQGGVKHHLLDIIEPNQKFSVAEFKKRAAELIKDIWARGRFPIMVGGTGLYIDSVLFDYQFSEGGRKAEDNPRHLENDPQADRSKPIRDNTLVLGINPGKDVLLERIEKRVEQMFADGLIDEVKKLSGSYGMSAPGMLAPGYKVGLAYMSGEIQLDEAKEKFKTLDIQLAKRQMTWFKRNSDIQWFEGPTEITKVATEFAEQFRV